MDINTKEVGDRIANCRKNLKMTQTELAYKLMVSSKTISKWEKGHGLPSIELLPDLAQIFNVSIDFILLGKGLGANGIKTKFKNIKGKKSIDYFLPSIEDYPKEVREHLAFYFLEQFALATNMKSSDLINIINGFEKTDTIDEKAKVILSFDTVSIAKIQRFLNLGFAKAAKIKDAMEKEQLISIYQNDKPSTWLNKDEKKLKEILKNIFSF